MLLKKRPLKDSLLCVILDRGLLSSKQVKSTANRALMAGADMIQLRGKGCTVKELIRDAVALKRSAAAYNVPVIINDRIDVAAAADSDGLHIGRSDIGISTAKKILGPDKIIGLSVSEPLRISMAKRGGADYIGVGPVFKTPIKASGKISGIGLLKKMRRLNMPIIAIGGINIDNVGQLVRNGFRRVAVIRAVCLSCDVSSATRRLKEAIE